MSDMRGIPVERYVVLLESHIAVLESRVSDLQTALTTLHEVNVALKAQIPEIQPAAEARPAPE